MNLQAAGLMTTGQKKKQVSALNAATMVRRFGSGPRVYWGQGCWVGRIQWWAHQQAAPGSRAVGPAMTAPKSAVKGRRRRAAGSAMPPARGTVRQTRFEIVKGQGGDGLEASGGQQLACFALQLEAGALPPPLGPGRRLTRRSNQPSSRRRRAGCCCSHSSSSGSCCRTTR